VGLLSLLVGCGQAQPAVQPSPSFDVRMKPTGGVAAVRPPGAPRAPVTVDGTRDAKTELFRLEGGCHTVAWAVTPPPDDSCRGGLALKSPDQPTFEEVLVPEIDSSNSAKRTTQSYQMQAGSYAVSSTLSCPVWSVRFVPG
jgi:hypothetical protein